MPGIVPGLRLFELMGILPVPELAQQAIVALQKGDKIRARDLFNKAIEGNPYDERLWLWLSWAMDTEEERQQCLEQLRMMNPDHPAVNRSSVLSAAGGGAPTSLRLSAAASLNQLSGPAPSLPSNLTLPKREEAAQTTDTPFEMPFEMPVETPLVSSDVPADDSFAAETDTIEQSSILPDTNGHGELAEIPVVQEQDSEALPNVFVAQELDNQPVQEAPTEAPVATELQAQHNGMTAVDELGTDIVHHPASDEVPTEAPTGYQEAFPVAGASDEAPTEAPTGYTADTLGSETMSEALTEAPTEAPTGAGWETFDESFSAYRACMDDDTTNAGMYKTTALAIVPEQPASYPEELPPSSPLESPLQPENNPEHPLVSFILDVPDMHDLHNIWPFRKSSSQPPADEEPYAVPPYQAQADEEPYAVPPYQAQADEEPEQSLPWKPPYQETVSRPAYSYQTQPLTQTDLSSPTYGYYGRITPVLNTGSSYRQYYTQGMPDTLVGCRKLVAVAVFLFAVFVFVLSVWFISANPWQEQDREQGKQTTAPMVYGIGDDVQVADMRWGIADVQRAGSVLPETPDSPAGEAIGRFVRVYVEVENLGIEQFVFEGGDIIDMQGRLFQHETDDEIRSHIPTEQQCLQQPLMPHEEKTCQLIFDLPRDATALQFRLRGVETPNEVPLIDLDMPGQ